MTETKIDNQAQLGEFHHQYEVEINAPREKVWETMTGDVGEWWNHTFSEKPARLYIEPKAGGYFGEDFDSHGNGCIHAVVTFVKKPEKLVYRGWMGMQGPVNGVISVVLEENNGVTIMKLSHQCTGKVDEVVANGYGEGWKELNIRLKELVETGKITS
ncbi:MAG TPA: SRPBCC domain-containing protein [bacterium]|jgi:uncharacterized protein YndB with AHSA1/START domain